jgi:hypothetical protein
MATYTSLYNFSYGDIRLPTFEMARAVLPNVRAIRLRERYMDKSTPLHPLHLPPPLPPRLLRHAFLS